MEYIMSRCNYCGLEILDEAEQCPLCNGILEHTEGGAQTYPDVVSGVKKVNFVFRLFFFLSIVASCLCIVLNLYFTPGLTWGWIVSVALAYGLWLWYIILKDNAGYRIRILSGVAGAVIMIILIDALLGFEGWSVSYVFPGGIVLIDLALAILMLVNRRNWQSYMMTEILMILLSIIPEILLLTGVIHFPYLVWAAMGASVFLFLGTLILGDQRARTELKRRFHI